MDYVKFYETETGKKLPRGFDVHHIDHNRRNNEIKNLVALPRKLHQLYHKIEIPSNFHIYTNLLGSMEAGNAYNQFCLDQLSKFVPVFNECKKYIDYRDFLLGKITNIHNLNL